MNKDDYCRILTQGEENLKKIYSEEGELEAVFEKRSVECKEGYFLIQVSSSLCVCVFHCSLARIE